MIKQQLIYKDLAKYYDKVYNFKNYEKEVLSLKQLIKKYCKNSGKTMLDIACGTGEHLKYIEKDFDCYGIDINKPMLDIAKRKLKRTKLVAGNMTNFKIGKRFDIVTCLFSSIGYVKTYSNLEKTLKNIYNHLSDKGIVVLDFWFNKSNYFVGLPSMTTYDSPDLKIARLSMSKIKGNISIMEMQYLIAEKNKDIKHFSERHELGLFEYDRIIKIMNKIGFKTYFIKNGLNKKRNICVGVR